MEEHAHEKDFGSSWHRRRACHHHRGGSGAGARPWTGPRVRSRRRRASGRRDRRKPSLLLWAGLLRLLRTAKLLRPRLRLLWRRAVLLSAPLLSLLLIGETKPGVLLRAVS